MSDETTGERLARKWSFGSVIVPESELDKLADAIDAAINRAERERDEARDMLRRIETDHLLDRKACAELAREALEGKPRAFDELQTDLAAVRAERDEAYKQLAKWRETVRRFLGDDC